MEFISISFFLLVLLAGLFFLRKEKSKLKEKTGNCEENRSSQVECGVILAKFLFLAFV